MHMNVTVLSGIFDLKSVSLEDFCYIVISHIVMLP